jgi:hypothetical protein
MLVISSVYMGVSETVSISIIRAYCNKCLGIYRIILSDDVGGLGLRKL